MTTWEYLLLSHRDGVWEQAGSGVKYRGFDSLAMLLDTAGKAGWEVCGYSDTWDGGTRRASVVLKRFMETRP